MSLRTKFTVASAIVAIIAIGVVAFGVRALNATSDMIVRLYDQPLMGVSYARAASGTLAEAHALTQANLLDGEAPPSDSVALLGKMEKDIAADLSIVRARVHDVTVTNALDHANVSIGDWFRSQKAILSPPPEGLTQVPTQAFVDRQRMAATVWLDDLVELVAANGFEYRTKAETEIRSSNATLAVVAAGILLLGTLTVMLFARFLIGPIRAATRIAEDIAGGGIATIVVPARRDEIGRLMRCLASMQANLLSRFNQAQVLLQEKDHDAETLRGLNLRFDAVLNNMSHGLLMCDADSRVVVMNRRFCEIYGIDESEILPDSSGQDATAVGIDFGSHPGRKINDIVAELEPALKSNQRSTVIRTTGLGRTIAITHEPMADGGWIATHEDISERLQAEEQLIFLSQNDTLTQLPNRATLRERLNQALAQSERGLRFAILSLDLDQFKAVNDTLGHLAGDSVLCEVAKRLQDTVREVDTVARVGGDEFCIIQSGAVTASDAAQLASRIVESISRPYDVDGHQVVIGVSIGIALAPGDSAHPAQLLQNADLALYLAKLDGKNTWRFFEPTMDALAKTRRQVELDLRDALSLGQLELHYQPVVCRRRRIVTSFEALLRWRHPTRGLVPPGEFISIAEETGIITSIGTWVLEQACTEAATWPSHLRVAVNLSPLQFRSQALVNTVSDALKSSGLAADRLELEITESVPLQDDDRTLSILRALRALGPRITLDDFGTGYSSLSYLRCFPFDTLKIDRSFVSDLRASSGSAEIVRAITALAINLNMHVTAEGVETEEQFAFVADAGCTDIQGYLFSRPVPADALPALIERLSASAVSDLSVSTCTN